MKKQVFMTKMTKVSKPMQKAVKGGSKTRTHILLGRQVGVPA